MHNRFSRPVTLLDNTLQNYDFKKISHLTGMFSSLTEVENFYLNDINETIAAFIPLNLGEFFDVNWKHKRRNRRARLKI